MAHIDGPARDIAPRLVAQRFDALFAAGVTVPWWRVTQGLKLALPEEVLIAPMWDDVVSYRCRGDAAGGFTHAAEGLGLELLTTLAASRPHRLLVPHWEEPP